jgi:hypothetical protein
VPTPTRITISPTKAPAALIKNPLSVSTVLSWSSATSLQTLTLVAHFGDISSFQDTSICFTIVQTQSNNLTGIYAFASYLASSPTASKASSPTASKTASRLVGYP